MTSDTTKLNPLTTRNSRHHVVIIGAGFGGIFAAKRLANENVDVTIIDRSNTHVFQPLLYQVATGILSPGEIASSIRQIFHADSNIHVARGEVQTVDTANKTVTASQDGHELVFNYDSLIVAAGAAQSYFGNDQFAKYAPGMKSIDDALEIRSRIISAFERAEMTTDQRERDRLLTFAIVGAGPTGVELAGQVAEMANRTLTGEYSNFDPADARIVLIDGAPQVLPPFGKKLGRKAANQLRHMGVEIILGSVVTDVNKRGLTYKNLESGEETTIEASCKIWSAGVAASPLGKIIAQQSGIEVDRAGRVPVNSDLTVGDNRDVFVVGDMMSFNSLPGVAQVAIQGGKYVAEQIAQEARGRSPEERPSFEYFDKGSMATVSRFQAVVKLNKVKFAGFFGWATWLIVHLAFIVGFRNRLVSMVSWGLNSISRKRWHLDTTQQQLYARNGLDKLAIELPDAAEVRETRKLGNSNPAEKWKTGK
ncbi:NAD(P)/FAD-dependent oxidoreductase [Corynebacterium kroppenstedtii]|uniref:NAD(P)/FAD-dependent oxidoreductase n=1 Tax=Corynebacterium sp. PCR 32 TaxID=3351342 RepID=UPI0030A3383C